MRAIAVQQCIHLSHLQTRLQLNYVHSYVLSEGRQWGGGGRHTHDTHTPYACNSSSYCSSRRCSASSKRDARGRASGLYKLRDSGDPTKDALTSLMRASINKNHLTSFDDDRPRRETGNNRSSSV